MRPIDHATNVQSGPFPLQQDYQRFLLLGSRRAPHTLYMHERGYRSGTINTDSLSMRYSHCGDRRFSVAEHHGAKRVNLLVGGSTTLGIGASSDEHTVVSYLSALTGEVWLSLAGCGLNATQELLMFLTHQHRFGEIGHVVVLSGLNTLAHEALKSWPVSMARSMRCPTLACSTVSTKACKPPKRPAAHRSGTDWAKPWLHVTNPPRPPGPYRHPTNAWRARPRRSGVLYGNGTVYWPMAMQPSPSSCNPCCPGAGTTSPWPSKPC